MGFAWSEISRRYVKNVPEVYIPEMLRKGSLDIKQGSLDEPVEFQEEVSEMYMKASDAAVNAYMVALAAGVCPEQARGLLPQNVYTEWHWTGSLLGWARVWGLRVKPDAQRETKEVVEMIGPKMEELFPVSWRALTNG